MQRLSLWWWYLAQNTRCVPRQCLYIRPAESIATMGARKYTQIAVQIPEGNAEPTVRAGFMLMPERGDSTLMKAATRKPATHGVDRVNLRELATFKTTVISRNEIANSAAKATQGPPAPGTGATNGTRARAGPSTIAERRTPAKPPANCAIT